VIERRRDLGLAEEQIAELGPAGELGQKLLEHHLLFEALGTDLLAHVDRTHTPFCEVSLDAILPRRNMGGHHCNTMLPSPWTQR
jgi:hypothetical protein